MIRKLKWYYKLLIIIGIMIIMSCFTNFGFIYNVKAEELPNFYFNIPNSDNLKSYYNDSLITNFMYDNVCDSNTNLCERGDLITSISSSDLTYNRVSSRTYFLWNSDFSYVSTYPNGYNSTDKLNDYVIPYPSSGTNYGSYTTRLWYGNYTSSDNGMPYFTIEKGKTYEVMFEIVKDSNSYYRSNLPDFTINNFDITLKANNNTYTGADIYHTMGRDYVDILDFKYFVYSDSNEYDNYAYLKIRFKLKDRVVGISDTIYEENDSFILYNLGAHTSFNNEQSRNCFIQKIVDSGNTNRLKFTISRVVLLENGYVSFAPGFDNPDFDNIDLDSVSLNDLSIFDRLDSCDNLDIVCHINNILTMIKNNFIRLGNIIFGFIENLRQLLIDIFIPRMSDISQMFQDFREAFLEKLGFLGYFIELFENFITDITSLTLNPDPAITLPAIKEPFNDITIYPGGTYYIKYYMTYGSLGTLYNIYYLFISAYFIFLFINFCVDSIDDIFTGRVGGNITGSMLEQMNTDDYEGAHEYTGKHSERHVSLYSHLRNRRR